MSKEVGAGGRFEIFLESAIGYKNLVQTTIASKNLVPVQCEHSIDIHSIYIPYTKHSIYIQPVSLG